MDRFAILTAVIVVAAGCGGSKSNDVAPAESLTGKTWSLVMLDGANVPAAQDRRHPSLRFDAAEQRVTGHAGVNQFGGLYTLDGKKLTFGPLAMTRMAGPPQAMELENRFSGALNATTGWRIDHGQLQLLSGNHLVAQFKPIAQ